MTATTATDTLTGHYRLDPAHSRIGFVARHAMVTKVRGSFSEVDGAGYLDAVDPANSSLQVTIEAHSIDTRNADRDAHLRSNDFLAMDEYPQITFVSTAFDQASPDVLAVTGDLTLRGVTRSVAFELELTGPAVDPFGSQRIGLEGQVVINRKDWGVNWNAALEAGGVLVSEKITLEFEISAVRQVDGA